MVFPLSEGAFTIGHDKVFVPFDAAHDVLSHRPTGSLLVEVQPFLVATDEDVILLDTGLGFTNNGRMQIDDNLALHGYKPAEVTKVLLSHLHKDHAGGLLRKNPGGSLAPAFPLATYYIYREEADYALQTGDPSYHPEDLEPLFSSGQVVWLDGPEGSINEHISFRHSGGHCPQHIVFFLEHDHNRTLFYGGDEAPQLKQMKMRYVAKYDYDGQKAMKLRAQWAEEGHRQGWTALFYHDVKCPMARL